MSKQVKKGLGASARKASRSVSASKSSAKKPAGFPATPSRAPAQAPTVQGLMDVFLKVGHAWFNEHKLAFGPPVTFEEYTTIGRVPEQIKMLRPAIANYLTALGARSKPTKEAVPASRRTAAKRSAKRTGGSSPQRPNKRKATK